MRNLRRVVLVLGGVVSVATAGAVAAVGCGGDDTHLLPEAGTDGTTDSPIDVQVVDSTQQDVQSDVVEAGVFDGDSSAAIPPFMTEVATAFCAKLKACCASQAPDGSAFDTAACIAVNTPVGFEGTALGAVNLLEAGLLSYDPNKAQACLNDINAIDCTGNVMTSQQHIAILTDCTAAVTGNFAAGTTCSDSIECASGQFCNTTLDSGVGKCAPLRGDGGACGDFGDIPTAACATSQLCDYGLSEEACSYRRTGNTGLRCNNADPNTGGPIDGGPAAWTCMPAGGVDAGCTYNQDCVSTLCDPGAPGYPFVEPDGAVVNGGATYLCVNSIRFAYPNGCLAFTK